MELREGMLRNPSGTDKLLFVHRQRNIHSTEIKPPEKKNTEIYAGVIDQLSKKNVGKFVARFCDNEGSS